MIPRGANPGCRLRLGIYSIVKHFRNPASNQALASHRLETFLSCCSGADGGRSPRPSPLCSSDLPLPLLPRLLPQRGALGQPG